MDTIPVVATMDNPQPLAGLDPVDLLKQGVAEDTFMDDAPSTCNPPSLDEIAASFPRFEILEFIGKGGMGVVYKVRQKDLDRIVALKILPPAIGGMPGFADRFAREAKALARLNHPGIVTLHEFGQQDGLYFILMEFVDGVNLAQLMKTGRISPREALAIVPQICDALQFAHDQGIVHRDIKPENILLDRLGRVKVADFGIAKVVASVCDRPADEEENQRQSKQSGDGGPLSKPQSPQSQPDSTLAGKIIGTPAYMAPEQIEHPSDVDHRADIYALGVVFYQMLTGELPGKDLQAPSKIVRIDVRLDEIVLQAMEQNPELRFQQASVMKTRVDDLATPQEMTVPPPVKSSSTGKMIAIGCGLLVLIVGFGLAVLMAVYWWLFSVRLRLNEEKSVQQTVRLEEETTRKTSRKRATSVETSIPRPATTKVTGTMALPKDFSETKQAAVAEAAQALFDSCDVTEESTESQMSEAQDDGSHIRVTFSDAEKGGHPDEMLITFPLTSGSVWTKRGDIYQRHGKFSPTAAVNLAEALGEKPTQEFKDAAKANTSPEKEAAATAEAWLAGIDAGNYAQSWKTAAVFFQSAITEAGWSDALTKVRKPLGDVNSRKLLDAKSTKTLPGLPDAEYVVMSFKTTFAAQDNAEETVTFIREKDGTWKAAGYFIHSSEMEVAATAEAWLAGIDAGNYAQSWKTAAALFRQSITETGWSDALTKARKPLGIMKSRKLLSAKIAKKLPGAPDGDYVVMQFETSFAAKEKAVETVTFTKEEDGTWKASGYFIR